MILDLLIAGCHMLWIMFWGVVELVLNVVLLTIQSVMALYAPKTKLKRVKLVGRKKKDGYSDTEATVDLEVSPIQLKLAMVLLTLGLGWFVVPKLWNQKVIFKAEDGQVLPFASIVVKSKDGGERHVRTNLSGEVEISRFDTESIRIDDKRYVEQNWSKDQIGSKLTVKRSLLGSSLDSAWEHVQRAAVK